MTDATTHTHSEGVEGGLRARIRALGPDAIAEIARRAARRRQKSASSAMG
jgi:hypothetical protein